MYSGLNWDTIIFKKLISHFILGWFSALYFCHFNCRLAWLANFESLSLDLRYIQRILFLFFPFLVAEKRERWRGYGNCRLVLVWLGGVREPIALRCGGHLFGSFQIFLFHEGRTIIIFNLNKSIIRTFLLFSCQKKNINTKLTTNVIYNNFREHLFKRQVRWSWRHKAYLLCTFSG